MTRIRAQTNVESYSMNIPVKTLTVGILALAAAYGTSRSPLPIVDEPSPMNTPNVVGAFALQRWGGERIGGSQLARIDTRTGEAWLIELDVDETAAATRQRYRWVRVNPAK